MRTHKIASQETHTTDSLHSPPRTHAHLHPPQRASISAQNRIQYLPRTRCISAAKIISPPKEGRKEATRTPRISSQQARTQSTRIKVNKRNASCNKSAFEFATRPIFTAPSVGLKLFNYTGPSPPQTIAHRTMELRDNAHSTRAQVQQWIGAGARQESYISARAPPPIPGRMPQVQRK